MDVRLIAATHRNLKALCEEGRFRPDLFYRINVVQLSLPPLRERGEDVGRIAEALLSDACRRLDCVARHLSSEALRAIGCYHWPGNIRELENAIERAVILSEGEEISHEALGLDLDLPSESDLGAQEAMAQPHAPPGAEDPTEDLSLEEYFQRFVLQNQDHMSETELARKLGVSRKCLWERRQRFGIPRKKGAGEESPGLRRPA